MAGRTPLLFCLLLGCAAGTAVARASEPTDANAVLRLEDVVRWHVAGVSEQEIVRRIAAAQVDFDLADDMVEELRLAGIPDAVLRAMAARQDELHPKASPVPEAGVAVAPNTTSLVLALRGRSADAAPRLRLPTRVPKEIAAQLKLEDPAAEVTGVAIYVACVRAPHVPSYWRAASPLGRDFTSMPRHEMLAFVPLGTGSAPPERSIDVEVPSRIDVPIDAADTHDLSVGIAVRIGDRHYRVTSDVWPGLVPRDHPDGIEAILESGGTLAGLAVRFARAEPTAAGGT